eukprot:snap_masked-scaffold422_size175911-processed-gene-0.19 protein:Tk09765 transcript:snap_masked-scaffold422_size175911-processed-gene-0.19-mRNA-1 annotation:"hypothetical protein BRAFLDRAFT_205444"
MDNYQRIRVVGRGAFGTVYLCRRISDGKEVIIKEIPVEGMTKNDRLATMNEVRILALLDHPNVIEYYENFIQDQAMMIVMDFAAGGTLHDLIQNHASQEQYLEESEIVHLFAQIVLPMNMVHSRQILHRDLKSQNIFLTKSLDHVKIGDFGISKVLTSKSKAFTVVGTPCYISPELCEGKAYNQKSDVWALGCILYEMCALKRAFEAPTLPALVLKIMRGKYHPLPGHYSPGLRDFFASLLAVDPGQRPTIPEMMAHPWLAPTLYRIPTSLGALPCTTKPPRPLSMTRPDDFVISQAASSPLLLHRQGTSPFSAEPRRILVLHSQVWQRKAERFDVSSHQTLELVPNDGRPRQNCVELVQMCAVSTARTLGVTNAGQVLDMRPSAGHKSRTSFLEGLSGIHLSHVSGAPDYLCLVSDRGILFTLGQGASGCLGHGSLKDVMRPKIVEALLGDEISALACLRQRVGVLTSEREVFLWGLSLSLVPRKLDLGSGPLPELGELVLGSNNSLLYFVHQTKALVVSYDPEKWICLPQPKIHEEIRSAQFWGQEGDLVALQTDGEVFVDRGGQKHPLRLDTAVRQINCHPEGSLCILIPTASLASPSSVYVLQASASGKNPFKAVNLALPASGTLTAITQFSISPEDSLSWLSE